MYSKAIFSFFEYLNIVKFAMFLIAEDRLGNIVGVLEEEGVVNLLKVVAEVVVSHIKNTKAVCFRFLFKLLSVKVAYYFAPKLSILFASQSIPTTFTPRVAKLHQLVVNSLCIFKEGCR